MTSRSQRRTSRWARPLGLGLIVLGATAWSFEVFRSDTTGEEREPVASIDGEPVSLERFNLLYRLYSKRMLLGDGALPEGPALQKKVELADQLIDQALIARAAAERGIKISDGEVDLQMELFRSRFPSDEEFRGYLDRRFIEGEPGLREELRLRLILEGLVATKGPLVEDEQVSLFYEQNLHRYRVPEHYQADEVLVRTDKEMSGEEIDARGKSADTLRLEVIEGRLAFADAARRSDGVTAAVGGDLGRVTQDSVEPRIWEAILDTPLTEVSKVFQTSDGFRFIRVRARVPAVDRELPKVAEEIRAELERLIRHGREEALMQSLRRGAEARNLVAERYAAQLPQYTVPIAPLASLAFSLAPGVQLPDPVPTGGAAEAGNTSPVSPP